MNNWSDNYQSPAYLKATRQAYLNTDFTEVVLKYTNIKDGSKVLEVGCGIGCFSRYLSEKLTNVSFTGVDNDAYLIQNGLSMYGNNSMEYIIGDAYALPFEAHTFDVVVSHTFFNCIQNPKGAMEEMKRVVKVGGTIVSVTSMSLGFETWYKGDYPEKCHWNSVILEASSVIYRAFRKNRMDCTNANRGVATSYMPSFFTKSNLKNIKLMPLSRAFSLSNGALDIEEKRTYIVNMYEADCDRISRLEKHPEIMESIDGDFLSDYKQALREKRDFWLSHLEDNTIWDWFGSSSLLVSGIVK